MNLPQGKDRLRDITAIVIKPSYYYISSVRLLRRLVLTIESEDDGVLAALSNCLMAVSIIRIDDQVTPLGEIFDRLFMAEVSQSSP
jgi:hypothetical protein